MRLYADGVASVEPKHLFDTCHVSHNHKKYIKNMSELTIHEPAKFKYEKQKMQDNFLMDLAERCQAEFTQAFNKFHNDTLKFKKALSYTCDAIVNCYHGLHDLCHIYSFVCMTKCNTTWLQRSPFLRKDFTIKSCDESLNLVRKCMEYRLFPPILEKTKMNANTQKVEATNRSMRRSLPKHLTFLRNFPGRAHSAAHNITMDLANQYTNCVRLLALHSQNELSSTIAANFCPTIFWLRFSFLCYFFTLWYRSIR